MIQMSEERLEEISKNATGILNMDNGEVDSVDLPLLDFTWLYKYAKEQTDHAEELEKKLRVDNELFEKQVQQNKRYREAFHEIRRIDNDPDVNYCEFASLVKDIVDESLKNG